MNILCNICYFVVRKCDCIGVFSVAIQSKSFKNVTIIEQNKVKWTFCSIFAILLLESVIALVCIWLQFKANHSRMWWQLNRIKWNEHFVQDLLFIRKCDCIGVYLVAIQSKSFKNVMAIEQNKVKWTFCARFAILLLESVIALVCIWLQFKANHSRMWWQLNRIKWNEHFVQDLLTLLESVIALDFVAIQSKCDNNCIKWNEHFVQDLLFCY